MLQAISLNSGLLLVLCSGEYDTIIHAGDFAYDLDTKMGLVRADTFSLCLPVIRGCLCGGVRFSLRQNGDDFMNSIQPMSATLPYMTCIGNHGACALRGPASFA